MQGLKVLASALSVFVIVLSIYNIGRIIHAPMTGKHVKKIVKVENRLIKLNISRNI